MARKWFTRARRFPQLIGRTPDGTRLWGGPYTYLQLATMASVALIMWRTTWLWAHGTLIFNAAIFLTVVIAAVYAAGHLGPTSRNPLVLLGGLTNITGGWRTDNHRLHPPTRNATQLQPLGAVPVYELAPTPTPQTNTAPDPTSHDHDATNTTPDDHAQGQSPDPSVTIAPDAVGSAAGLSEVQQLLLGGRP